MVSRQTQVQIQWSPVIFLKVVIWWIMSIEQLPSWLMHHFQWLCHTIAPLSAGKREQNQKKLCKQGGGAGLLWLRALSAELFSAFGSLHGHHLCDLVPHNCWKNKLQIGVHRLLHIAEVPITVASVVLMVAVGLSCSCRSQRFRWAINRYPVPPATHSSQIDCMWSLWVLNLSLLPS